MKALRIFMVMALGIVLAMGLVACGSSDSGGGTNYASDILGTWKSSASCDKTSPATTYTELFLFGSDSTVKYQASFTDGTENIVDGTYSITDSTLFLSFTQLTSIEDANLCYQDTGSFSVRIKSIDTSSSMVWEFINTDSGQTVTYNLTR